MYGWFLIYTVVLTVLLSAIIALYRLWNSPLRHVPGPWLAKVTNLWRMLLVYQGHAERRHQQLHDQFGSAVRLGPNMVSISDPSMIPVVFSRKDVLQKSEFYAVNDLNVNGRRVPNIFSTRDEHQNTQILKPIVKLFSMTSLLKMEALLDSTISFFIQRLDEGFASTAKPCDMASWLHYCAWDVIGEITFSKRMGFLETGLEVQDMCKINHEAMNYFAVVGMMPWLDLFLDKNPVKRFGPPFLLPAVAFSLQRLEERSSKMDGHDKTSTPDFLDGFLDAQAESPEVVTDDIVLAYLMANVVAGSDTVTAGLCSILYHLCRDIARMARLQAELDQADHKIPLSWTQTQALPYLRACVEEGIRLMPGVSLPLERVVGSQGMKLPNSDVFLPRGTVVGINPWVVNRDRATFGQDADQFRPERWFRLEDEDETTYEQRVSRMHSADLTFGAGKRQCPGKSLALLECHKIVGSLVHTFDIELVNPDQEWTTHTSWFVKQSNMDVRLKRRL